jgi:hypothetical protein
MTEQTTRKPRVRRATKAQLQAVIKMMELGLDDHTNDEPLYDEALRVVIAELAATAEKRS